MAIVRCIRLNSKPNPGHVTKRKRPKKGQNPPFGSGTFRVSTLCFFIPNFSRCTSTEFTFEKQLKLHQSNQPSFYTIGLKSFARPNWTTCTSDFSSRSWKGQKTHQRIVSKFPLDLSIYHSHVRKYKRDLPEEQFEFEQKRNFVTIFSNGRCHFEKLSSWVWSGGLGF